MCQAKPALRCRADAVKNYEQAKTRLSKLLAVPPAEQDDRAIETAMFTMRKTERARDLTIVALHAEYLAKSGGYLEDITRGNELSDRDTADYEAIKPLLERYKQLKSGDQTRFEELKAEAAAKHNLSKWFKSGTVPSRAQDVANMFDHLTSVTRSGEQSEGGRDLNELEQELYDEAQAQIAAGKEFMVEADTKRKNSSFEAHKQDLEVGNLKTPTPLPPRPIAATDEERERKLAARLEAGRRHAQAQRSALHTTDAINQHALPKSVKPTATQQQASAASRQTSDAILKHSLPTSVLPVATARGSREAARNSVDAITQHELPEAVRFNEEDRRRVAAQGPTRPFTPSTAPTPKPLSFREWVGKAVFGKTVEAPRKL
jgi:hypothetical protein